MKKRFKPGTEIENPIVFSSIAGQSENINKQKDVIKANFLIIWFFLNLILVIIAGRVFYLQIIRGSYYQKMAENNRIKTVEVKAPRGLIVDKSGEIIASNIPSFDIAFIPNQLSENRIKREQIYSELAKECDLEIEEIKNKIESIDSSSKNKYLIKEGLDYEKALVLIEKLQKFPGIYLEKTAKRKYEKGEIFSSILGYTGKINKEELKNFSNYSLTGYIGKNGLEYTYEEKLKGENGKILMEVNSDGTIKEELEIKPSVSGDKLILNIDSKIQNKSYQVLKKILEVNEEATGAVMVALDPRDGAVRGLVSLPTYDNNLFIDGIKNKEYSQLVNNSRKPMTNRAISGEYPPGSVFKPLLAAIALEEDIVKADTVINCTGVISVGNWSFRDWKTHGKTDLNKAIAESCNVYFYAIGGGWNNIEGLGVNKMNKYSEYFGLGNILGIDIPTENSGRIPNEEWKFKEIGERWYVGDSYHMSIGQGFMTTTPLQIAAATATIVNEGTLYQPQIVSKIVSSSGHENEIKPKIIRSDFISEENFKKVKSAMRETVLIGSGQKLNDMKTETAGKTGTAQFGNQGKTHSWYASFGPYKNPEIVTVILIESGGEGHDWAVPATEQILREYFNEEEEEVNWEMINNIVKNRAGLSEATF